MKTGFKSLAIISLAFAIQPGLLAQSGPMQCGTKMSKTTDHPCSASGCDTCEQQQSQTDYLFCTTTTDTVACWRTSCPPFTATYQRRTGECDNDCVCQFGAWVDVTTTFDHTNMTDECSG